MKRSILIVCALGCAILLGTLVSQAENSPDKSAGNKQPTAVRKPVKMREMPVFGTGEAAIEAALSRPTPPIEFVEEPLKNVIEYLKDAARIEIVLDEIGCKEAEVDHDRQVTRNLRGIALADALDILLDELGLVWTVHNDALWITSPGRAESYKYLETRVYDVADLVVYQDEKGVKFDDYSPLTDTITSTVAEKSWEDNGGAGAIHGESLGTAKVLVITQSYRSQKRIVTLLARVREVAAEKHGDAVPHRERGEPLKPFGFISPGMNAPPAPPSGENGGKPSPKADARPAAEQPGVERRR